MRQSLQEKDHQIAEKEATISRLNKDLAKLKDLESLKG